MARGVTWVVTILVVSGLQLLQCLEAAPCTSTGRACVKDCSNMADGDYQSCTSCHMFVKCSNHRLYNMPCPADLVWDDNAKTCVVVSHTCKGCDGAEVVEAKPGTCPAQLPDVCVEMCSTDYDCPGGLKCCPTKCGHICSRPTPTEDSSNPISGSPGSGTAGSVSAGECPATAHYCSVPCTSDSDCVFNMKCCNYPHSDCPYKQMCMNSADTPVNPSVNEIPEVVEAATESLDDIKPGSCPPPDPYGMCIYACHTDTDCPGPLKCCFNGCGFVCGLQAVQANVATEQVSDMSNEVPQVPKEAVRLSHIPTRRHCKSTGSSCVSDCTGRKDGDYQSCHGCGVYVSCVAGRRYDDRPCAPGGLVWDDNKKRCEYNSSTCHGCLCPAPCSGTGPACIRSCAGLPDGNYQSCKACNIFVSCSNGRMYDNRPCAPKGTVWDDNWKMCTWWSDTCHPPKQ